MTLQNATGRKGPTMTAELIIADSVREWTSKVLPGDTAAADAAVTYALGSFAAGGSVREACEAARSMVLCRARHPSSKARHRMAAAS